MTVCNRRGSAIIAALALLALGGALLVATSSIARATTRSTRSLGAALDAESQMRLALANAAASWSGALDSLAIGAGLSLSLAPRPGGITRLPVDTRLRVDRLTSDIYSVGVESQVTAANTILARRRARQILRRESGVDTSAVRTPPVPIGRWSIADVY